MTLTRRSLIAGGAALTLAPRGARAFARPAPIADRPHRLVFADDFDTLDLGDAGHRWAPRLWYERPVSAEHFSAANSILTLRLLRSGKGWEGCNIATEWVDTRGGTFFRGGYFEARMKLPRAWPAFWLFSVNHTRGVVPRSADPTTQCAEIDIFEGDSAHPSYFCGTLHSNTGSGGGLQDSFNRDNCHDLATDLTRDWHVYSALWTEQQVVWHLDGRETHRVAAYPSTWQDLFLILGVEPGGLLGEPQPAGGANPVDLLVDWVRVWAPAVS